ncbi:hypothetical protein BGZ49_003286 [Haplosporangium sp. Z 27]|nr:hypothetical protein BGZ49_003286 [Haplosporangium sp. Z 27]
MSRNPGKEFTEFKEHDLISSNPSNSNKFDIYCPQDSCRCKILLAGAGTLVQREKNKLSLPSLPLTGATVSTIDDDDQKTIDSEKKDSTENAINESSTEESTGQDLQSFWRVTNMMTFENIGFSKKLPNGKQFLSCADCDTGPLGYHEQSENNKEYLIALNRVRYHDRS